MFVYEMCKGLKLLAEGVSTLGWWIDPETGHKWENATYIDEVPGRYGSDGLKSASIYTYELRHEYSLELGCPGRDWHDVLAEMVGFDRDNQDAYPADGPFIELLHYDYSMETFGPSAARKIVADFDAWNDRASKAMVKVEIYKKDADAPDFLHYKPSKLVGVKHFNDHAFYLTYWWLRSCFANATENGVVRCYYKL
ncbi:MULTISPECIES: hypothetical protein [Ralstonia]|nr:MULTISPECIES: hypothetical protein [Ralstonia]EPX96705.1 hypothetical protein C404_16990 [Ralstonia sp. AU12-08]MBY4706644.1 hypothetical protein [Ralstonia insidiosa]